jgi:integrase
MNTSDPTTESRTGAVRHSREDRLTDLEFEELYNASYELDACTDLEARFVLLVGGRLGLRRGEIAHIQTDWIDWRKHRINIPPHYDCDLGRDNRACGSCRQHAQQQAEYNEEVSFEDAIAATWTPKTDMAVRSIPFDHCPRAELVLQDYFDEFERWMYSAQAINRRVDELIKAAGMDRNCYPHALRATAASYLAGRGMSTLSLQSMFGWSDPSTARNYVARSADHAERELYMIG